MSLLLASIRRIGSKATEKRWRHHFPHYKSMGAFCCHGHQGFHPICLKTLCSLSPAPVMLHIKFDQYWPTGLRDIQVESVKNERDSIETPFSHYKSMGNCLDAQGQLTPVVRSGRNSNSFEILCMSWLPASIKRIGLKATDKRWRHHFPNYKSMGGFLLP